MQACFFVLLAVMTASSFGLCKAPHEEGDRTSLENMARVDQSTYETLLKRALQATLERVHPPFKLSPKVGEAVFQRAKSDVSFYLEFDDIIQEAMIPPNGEYNRENDTLWLQNYFTELAELTLKENSRLQDERSLFAFINLARQVNLDATYPRSIAQITHNGDPEYHHLFIKVTDKLAQLAAKSEKYATQDLLGILSHGLYVFDYAIDGESIENLKFFIRSLSQLVDSFQNGLSQDVMKQVGQFNAVIKNQIAHETFLRLIGGSTSDHEFELMGRYEYFSARQYSIGEALKALSAKPEMQQKLAVSYFRWQARQPAHRLIVSDESGIFRLFASNFDTWLTSEEQYVFLKTYFRDLVIRPELADIGAALMNSHWPMIRKIIEETDSKKPIADLILSVFQKSWRYG